jgi:enterochelin esterase family protein
MQTPLNDGPEISGNRAYQPPARVSHGEIFEGELKMGETVSYAFSLAAGQALHATVMWLRSPGVIRVLNPTGAECEPVADATGMAHDIATPPADAAGIYRIELRSEAARTRPYVMRLHSGSTTPRLDRRQRVTSPRLANLAKHLQEDRPETVEQVWLDIARWGTPLVEDLAPGSPEVLVTFVWRGSATVEDVKLSVAGLHTMTRLRNTDLWYKSFPVRRGAKLVYWFIVRATADPTDICESYDLLNPLRFPGAPDSGDVPRSILDLTGAPPERFVESAEGAPAGRIEQTCFRSATLGNKRDLWIYTPPAYDQGAEPCGLLVMLDGHDYLRRMQLPAILDRLCNSGVIPPVVAAMVGNPSVGTRWRELRCNPETAFALHAELTPWLRDRYRVNCEAGRTIIGGYSRGGLTAAWAALCYPETFGNVISQSGSFWWAPETEKLQAESFDPYAEPNWFAREVAARPKTEVRYYLEAGTYENLGDNILGNTRHLRDVLIAKGNHVVYHEFVGAHDFISWRGTLPEAIRSVANSPDSIS